MSLRSKLYNLYRFGKSLWLIVGLFGRYQKKKSEGDHFYQNLLNLFIVPGNFHIATHSSKNKPAGYNFNHEIHDLYFGEDINDLDLKVPGNRTSLAGKKTDNSDHQLSYDYTLKIVPTVYTDITKKTKFGYQYTGLVGIVFDEIS